MSVRVQRWPLRTGDAWRATARYRGLGFVAYHANRSDAMRNAMAVAFANGSR